MLLVCLDWIKKYYSINIIQSFKFINVYVMFFFFYNAMKCIYLLFLIDWIFLYSNTILARNLLINNNFDHVLNYVW